MTVMFSEATLRLAAPERCMGAFCEHFGEHGAAIERLPGCVMARHALGTAILRAEAGMLTLRAEAADASSLAMLRGWVGGHVEQLAADGAPCVVWRGDGCGGACLPYFREMRVRAVAAPTPRVRRVTLAGVDLARFAHGGLHLRLLVPPPGVSEPEWPTAGANGMAVWPRSERAAVPRVYTIRRIDPEVGEIDLDVVTEHGSDGHHGPGAAWALAAQPGDRVGILGPGGGDARPADWTLLAGDETALPAIARILERMPAGARGEAIVEVADAAEEQLLARPPGMALRWLHRDGAAPGTTTLLPDAVRAVRWSEEGSVFAWAGAEFEAANALRRHFREERRLTRDEHLCVAYWQRAGG